MNDRIVFYEDLEATYVGLCWNEGNHSDDEGIFGR